MSGLRKDKIGELRLLQQNDLEKENAFGKPLVGWHPMNNGFGGIANPQGGWAVPRVVVRRQFEGEMKDLYDQPIIVEKAGSIVVCVLEDKVALIENFRMTSERPESSNNLIFWLEEGNWDIVLPSLGEWRWELPAGLADIKEAEDIEAAILGTAQKEAFEEAGLHVTNGKIIGRINMNPTFFPFDQYVVRVDVKAQGKARHEDLEIIGKMRFVGCKDLRTLVSSGEFTDSKSIAALAIAGFHF